MPGCSGGKLVVSMRRLGHRKLPMGRGFPAGHRADWKVGSVVRFLGSDLFLAELLSGHEPCWTATGPSVAARADIVAAARRDGGRSAGRFMGSHLFLFELPSEHEPSRGASDAGFAARGDIVAAARRDGGRSGDGRFMARESE